MRYMKFFYRSPKIQKKIVKQKQLFIRQT